MRFDDTNPEKEKEDFEKVKHSEQKEKHQMEKNLYKSSSYMSIFVPR